MAKFSRPRPDRSDVPMPERIKRMLLRTWDAIAPDAEPLLEGLRSRKARLEGIVEMTIDADRYDMYGDDPEAAAAFKALPSYEERERVAKEILAGCV